MSPDKRKESTVSLSTVIQDTHTLGGATVDIYLDSPGNFDGYYVALSGHEEKVAIDSFDAKTILGYLVRHFDALNVPDTYFGTWYNEDDGYVYLDVSVRVLDENEALRLGRKHGQIAVWDIGRNEAVPC